MNTRQVSKYNVLKKNSISASGISLCRTNHVKSQPASCTSNLSSGKNAGTLTRSGRIQGVSRQPTAAPGQGHLLQGCRNQRSGSSVGTVSLQYASNIDAGNDIASFVLLVPSGKTNPKGRRGMGTGVPLKAPRRVHRETHSRLTRMQEENTETLGNNTGT